MAEITLRPVSERIVVRWRGAVVADSRAALELREGAYPPVLYIPRQDVEMAFYAPSSRRTTCPHKGEASYFHLSGEAGRDENAVWSYEAPKASVAAIAGHVAFYPDKVEIARL